MSGQTAPDTQEDYVPIKDVAKRFSVSTSTVRSWVRNGRIPRDTYIKLGNTYRFRLGDITDHLLASKDAQTDPVTEAVEETQPEVQVDAELESVLDGFDEDEDI